MHDGELTIYKSVTRTLDFASAEFPKDAPCLEVVMHLHGYEEEVLVDIHVDGVRRVQVGIAVDDVAPGFS